MTRLERLDALGRTIRKDDVDELGTPNWAVVRKAIVEGRKADALELLDYGATIDQGLLDGLISYVDDMIGFLVEAVGEEQAFELVKKRYLPRVRDWLSKTPDVLETMQREVENQRGHYGQIEVTEEPDRYVVRCDPCGTGGRLRRTKDVKRTQEAHPWSWGKKDVPYYCSHCSLMWEIIPIEERGYPLSVFLPPEQDDDPCVHLYYKRPDLIPEEYFTRVGKAKPDFSSDPDPD